MFDVEESPIPSRKRELVPCVLYPPTVLNEFIKCVVIGDSGVGKTHLITAWACNTHYTLDQLVKTHVSTVWAHDHYRHDPDILEQSVVAIDGGYVALRLWDTFGYHDKDRGFAYKGADVILLCYSVAMPRSLNNLRKIWIPEIKRKAPTTPVVVVGCQVDLRYLYRDETYQKIHKGLMYKVVQEKDIVTPEQGRAVAREIGAPYYESSVYSKYGIEDIFLNVIRAAMVEKRKIRFWSSFLRRIQYPQIQEPIKLPPLLLPKVEIPDETLHDDLCSLIHDQSEGDVVFIVRGQCFRAHKICLAVSAMVFENLFLGNSVIVTENANKALRRSQSSLGDQNANTRSPGDTKSRRSSDTICPDNINLTQDYSILIHSAFLTVEENKACDNPYKPGEVTYQTVVTMRNEITPRAFQFILEYLYTGTLKEDYDCFAEVIVACSFLQLSDLALMISNLQGNEVYLNVELEKHFEEYRKSKLREIALNKERLADVRFLVDDGAVRAHKPLLMGRCEMMYAMFNNNFMESSADSIVLPGITRDVFLAVREFLYTGECSSCTLNSPAIIEAANRFCLPRLIRIMEGRVIHDLSDADRDGEDIIEDVIKLLEPAQLHNADILSDWCIKYLSNHFLMVKQKYLKQFHKLNADNIKFIEKNKWPPEWYMKELAYYDHMQAQSTKSKKSKRNFQQKQQFSRLDQCTNTAGCLCFCRRSKISREERDSSESPFDSVEVVE